MPTNCRNCTNTPSTLDTSGIYTSIAIGTDGNPVISYGGPGGALKVAHPIISG